MDVEILREFVTLSYNQSFKKTAQAHFIAQPTLSSHIRALEKELGFTLLERTNGNRLTNEGALFLSLIQEPICCITEALQTCRDFSNQPCAELVRISSCMWQDEIVRCMTNMPEVSFAFVPSRDDEPELQPLIQGVVDIKLIFDQSLFPEQIHLMETSDLVWEYVGRVECAIAIGASNPLAHKELKRSDLVGQTVIIANPFIFAHWKRIVETMLGRDLELRFYPSLDPNYDNNRIRDLGNAITVAPVATIDNLYRDKSATIVDRLEGSAFSYDRTMVYRRHPQNENVIKAVEVLRRLRETYPITAPAEL
ncbi:MAG: LysR family transcriptional regulator [Raoultibacter sp.]